MSKEEDKITSIDSKRIDRLMERGHYISMAEEFEVLRLKLLYDDELDQREAIRLVTLCKYFMEYGHSEPFKLSAKYLYERFMEPFDL